MKKIIWPVAYLLSVVLANWLTATFGLVGIGFGLAVTAGTFAAGAALLLRDAVQVSYGKAVLFACIVAGSLLSVVTSTPAIAVASGIAFAVSELVDTAVFTPVRERSLSGAVLLSSVVSAPVDTVLFLHLAGFPVTVQAALGQFLVKTVIALVVALALVRRRAVPVGV